MRTETLSNGADNFSQSSSTDDFLVNAQDGDDSVTTGSGRDSIYGGSGNDTLFGMGASDLIYGNRGADVIYGNQGDDRIYGGQDNDRVYGGQGSDVVYGNLGDDVAYGNLGNDVLYGGQGNDALYGGQGDDNLFGGLGSNTFVGGLGYDNAVVTGNTGDYRVRQNSDGSYELIAKDGSGTQRLDGSTEQVTFQNGQFLALRDLAAYVDAAGPAGGNAPGGGNEGGGGGGGGGNPPAPVVPTISVGDATVDEGNVVTVTFTLSQATSVPVSFNFATSDGTATTGTGDYGGGTGTVTIAAGQTSASVNFATSQDAFVEGSETFNVTVSNPSNATIADGTGVVTITDTTVPPPPIPPTISIGDTTATEGGQATFTVTRSGDTTEAITFRFITSDGTAQGAADYQRSGLSSTATIAAGATSGTFTVQTFADTATEGDETFTVDLSDAETASGDAVTIIDGTGEATITDVPPPLPTLSISDATATEGGAISFTATLSAASDLDVTFDFATADGTATAGSDYQGGTGTITIPAGQTSYTGSLQTLSDTAFEGSETFTVNISNVTNATIADGQGVGTITDPEIVTAAFANLNGEFTTPQGTFYTGDDTTKANGNAIATDPQSGITLAFANAPRQAGGDGSGKYQPTGFSASGRSFDVFYDLPAGSQAIANGSFADANQNATAQIYNVGFGVDADGNDVTAADFITGGGRIVLSFDQDPSAEADFVEVEGTVGANGILQFSPGPSDNEGNANVASNSQQIRFFVAGESGDRSVDVGSQYDVRLEAFDSEDNLLVRLTEHLNFVTPPLAPTSSL